MALGIVLNTLNTYDSSSYADRLTFYSPVWFIATDFDTWLMFNEFVTMESKGIFSNKL